MGSTNDNTVNDNNNNPWWDIRDHPEKMTDCHEMDSIRAAFAEDEVYEQVVELFGELAMKTCLHPVMLRTASIMGGFRSVLQFASLVGKDNLLGMIQRSNLLADMALQRYDDDEDLDKLVSTLLALNKDVRASMKEQREKDTPTQPTTVINQFLVAEKPTEKTIKPPLVLRGKGPRVIDGT